MYKQFFFLVFYFICITQHAFGQHSEVAETKLLIFNDESQPDSVRFKAIVQLTMSQLYSLPDSALLYSQKMYDLAKRKNEERLMTFALNYEGIAYGNLGNHEAAVETFLQNIELASKLGDDVMLAGTYINMANRNKSLGQRKEAIKNFKTGIALAQKSGDLEYESDGLSNLAKLFYDHSEYKKAREYYKRAHEVAIKRGYPFGIAKSSMMLGNVYFNLGDLSKSNEYLIQSKDYFTQLNHDKNVAGNLINLGRNYAAAGDYKTALKYYEEGIDILNKIGDKAFLSNAKLNMSNVFQKMGNYPEAIRLNNESIALKEELGNVHGIALNQRALASLYISNNDLDEARHFADVAMATSREINDRTGEAAAFDLIAAIYQKQNDFDAALNAYKESLKIYEETQSKQNVASNQINVGSIYEKLEQDAKAKRLLQQGIRTCRDLNQTTLLGDGLMFLGNLHFNNGDYSKSIPLHIEALTLAKKASNVMHVRDIARSLYLAYDAKSQASRALSMYELHVEMRDSIQNLDNQKAVLKQQIQYAYDAQKAIDDAENEGRIIIEQEKIKNQRRLSIAIGIGLIASLILAFFALNRLQVTRKQKVIIEKQKIQAEQSEKFKERFLANMSHEIRTPMHAISGMTNILKRNDHSPSQAPFLDAMQQSSKNLLVILNDILDLSKIEAGKIDIQSIPFQLKNTINHVYDLLKPHADEKGLELILEIDETLPENIIGDPQRLTQVLVNLVGNAIKFTEKGQIYLIVKKHEGKIRIAVRDTGIGIPQDKIDRMFESFEQMQAAGRTQRGTGLGLNISQQLVELQSGRIWAESKLGKGSTFYVELPLIESKDTIAEQSISETQIKEMASELKGCKILLVEDDAFNVMVATDDLKYYIDDVKIDVAQNGKEALEKITKYQYDVVLMDIDMPVMNGHEASRAIRQMERKHEEGNRTPIIAMTASLLESEINQCYESGMNDFIPKPYTITQLIGVLYRGLSHL